MHRDEGDSSTSLDGRPTVTGERSSGAGSALRRADAGGGGDASVGRPVAAARPAWIVLVSATTIGLGSFPGFALGFLTPALQVDLELSRLEAGLLSGVFFGATGVGSIPAGRLAQRVGARLVIFIDLLVVAAGLSVAAHWATFPVLLLTSMVAGVGYALVNAATNLVIVETVPVHRRGVALAVRTAGVPALVAITAVVAPWTAERFGWQWLFWGAAPLLVTAAGAVVLTFPAPSRGSRRVGQRALPSGLWWLGLAAFALICGSQAVYSWSVPYLYEAMGTNLGMAGIIGSVGPLAAVPAVIVVGLLVDRTKYTDPARGAAVASSTVALGLLLVILGHDDWVLITAIGLVVATVAQLAAVSLLHSAIVAAAPQAAGRATGVVMVGYYIGALIAGPGFGYIVDRTGSWVFGWSTCISLVLAAAVLFWTATSRTSRSAGR